MSTLEDQVALTDEELLTQLGRELWDQTSHAVPPSNRELRSNAKGWLAARRPKFREALCSNESVLAIRENANQVALAGAIADVLSTALGIPAASTVAILITRMGLDRLCAEEVPV
jgi:hypothetical protein